MELATLELSWDFTRQGFFTGAPSSSPGVFTQWDCALNGIGFMIDWADEQLQGPNTIPLYRYGGQLDVGVRPGEMSLSREDTWRRTVTSSHHGAGQRWSDRKTLSDEFRYRSSKGIDPWARDRLTLLNATTRVVASDTVTEIVAVGTSSSPMIFYVDASVIKATYFNADDTVNGGFSGTATGLPGNHPGQYNTLASDGTQVFAITGIFNPDSVYKSVAGGAEFFTSWATSFGGTVLNCIAETHGRIMVGTFGRKIYDATTTTPVLVGTLQDIGEQVVAFAEGVKFIYAASQGAPGHQSRVYSITYDPTTAALGTPVVAGIVPTGETIKTIFGYLGFLFIGTNTGFRMCREATDGSLTVGALVAIPGGVTSFAAVGSYVYFSWSNYDTTSAGLGRIDITVFTDADLIPAYSSDLMGSVTGTVPSVAVLDNLNPAVTVPRPYFAVTGVGGGIYQRHVSNFVASGTLDTGLVGFDLSEPKDLIAVNLRSEPLAGTIQILCAADEGAFTPVDIQTIAGTTGMFMPTHHIGGSRHELRYVLTRGSVTTAPVVSSVTMLAYPKPQRGEIWTLPLLVVDDVTDNTGYPMPVDFWTQVFAIRAMALGVAPVNVQIGSQSFQAHMSDYQTQPTKMSDRGRLQATVRVQLKNLDRQVAA